MIWYDMNITVIMQTHLSKNTVSFCILYCSITDTYCTDGLFLLSRYAGETLHLSHSAYSCANNTHFTYYFVTIYSYLIIERLNYSIWQSFINYIIWYILPWKQFGDLHVYVSVHIGHHYKQLFNFMWRNKAFNPMVQSTFSETKNCADNQ
jgi:hypothetical protein